MIERPFAKLQNNCNTQNQKLKSKNYDNINDIDRGNLYYHNHNKTEKEKTGQKYLSGQKALGIKCAVSIQKQIFPIRTKLKYPEIHYPISDLLTKERTKKRNNQIIQSNETGLKLIKKYEFKKSEINPEYTPEKIIPLRSCLLDNIAVFTKRQFHYTKTPKYLKTLTVPLKIDTGTGEIVCTEYSTDDLKSAKNRKIKTVEKFCNFYEPLYRQRKISVLFHTFSRADYSQADMRRMLEKIKRRYKSIGREILGYLWVIEFAENQKMINGLHIHYHLVISIKRIRVTEIPEALKFNDIWGQRTGVEFIKKVCKGLPYKIPLQRRGKNIRQKKLFNISKSVFC